VDEDFISRRRFAIFEGSDRGITMSVVTRVAAIAALLFAAACSGEPEVLEPDAGATSPSSSDTVLQAPEQPASARENSPSGAATFTSYWLSVSDYASLTGDTAELERISSPACGACAEFIELFRDTYSNGGSFTGGQQELTDVTTEEVSPRETVVRAEVDLSEGTYKASRSETAQPVASSKTRVSYRLERRGDSWLMKEFATDGQ
jgi:hypothetical protein